jgi:hypothetical protein
MNEELNEDAVSDVDTAAPAGETGEDGESDDLV